VGRATPRLRAFGASTCAPLAPNPGDATGANVQFDRLWRVYL